MTPEDRSLIFYRTAPLSPAPSTRVIKDARAKSCVAGKPGQEFTLPRRKPYPGRRVSCPGEHGRSMLSHKSSGNSKRVEKKSNALPSPVINSTFVKHGWKRVPPPRKTKRPIPRKRNGHERKGLYARFFRPLSRPLSLSLVPLESRFQFNADPSASLKLDRFFVRAIVGSFVRSFLEPRQARLETLLVRRCTPAVGGWQFREADSANEKLVGFDI